jgi:hypothetical protein
MTELEKAELLVDHYLKEYQLTTNQAEKDWMFDKAVYWSIEVDIERAWQDCFKRLTQ